jgi:hypothetical protein
MNNTISRIVLLFNWRGSSFKMKLRNLQNIKFKIHAFKSHGADYTLKIQNKRLDFK